MSPTPRTLLIEIYMLCLFNYNTVLSFVLFGVFFAKAFKKLLCVELGQLIDISIRIDTRSCIQNRYSNYKIHICRYIININKYIPTFNSIRYTYRTFDTFDTMQYIHIILILSIKEEVSNLISYFDTRHLI